MFPKYRIVTNVQSSGERLPILINKDGIPFYEANLFVLVNGRGRNRASNTIETYLRSLMHFMLFLDISGIDLKKRMESGLLFNIGEIETLIAVAKLPVNKLNALLEKPRELKSSSQPLIVSLEKVRKKQKSSGLIRINAAAVANKLRVIRDYLGWVISDFIYKSDHNSPISKSLQSAIDFTKAAINARIPSSSRFSANSEPREGLSPEKLTRVLETVDSKSKDNPWSTEFIKVRNELIINWLLNMGLRRGELLNVRISDFFTGEDQKKLVRIVRRPDDAKDPRKNQPKVKTRGRELLLHPNFISKTEEYILQHRSKIFKARKHDFLFVSTDGSPLSISSLNKIFRDLKVALPEYSHLLFPHIFRHTWNDLFSAKMTENKVDPAEENKQRSFLMGWSETSGTAERYTRRYTRIRAQKASLKLQNDILRKTYGE